MNQIFLWYKSCFFCFAGRISAMYGKQVILALNRCSSGGMGFVSFENDLGSLIYFLKE
jgi:hypothetical protein